jgi:benzodiazapine receptor
MRVSLRLLVCLGVQFQVSSTFQSSSRPRSYPTTGSLQHQASKAVRPTENPHSHQLQRRLSSLLPLSSASDSSVSTSNPAKFDYDAVFKYITAIGVQVGLFSLLFSGLDKLVAHFCIKVPTAVNFVLFYFMALKSRVLNPLSNNRPKPKSLEANDQPKRRMPSFTPPGVVFPIVWLLIVGPIRAASSCMIYNKLGVYASMPLLALVLHLSIGDVWNTINNVERRYGASVVGVFCVWLSKANAAYQYYKVIPLAGKLLAGTLIWLSIAATLIAATWRLNPDETGKLSPLYPATGQTKTKFAWFAGSKSQ